MLAVFVGSTRYNKEGSGHRKRGGKWRELFANDIFFCIFAH